MQRTGKRPAGLPVAIVGECLSASDRNCRTALHWRCAQGHTWWATLYAIKNVDTWCSHCSLGDERETSELCLCLRTRRGTLKYACRIQFASAMWQLHCDTETDWEFRFESMLAGHLFPRFRPPFLKPPKKLVMELDGYYSDIQLAFEYQGAALHGKHIFQSAQRRLH